MLGKNKYTIESLKVFLKTHSPGDEDFFEKLKMFENDIDNKEESYNFNLYHNLGHSLLLRNDNKDLNMALNYVIKAEVYVENLPEYLKRALYFVKGHINGKLKFAEAAKESFGKHIYYKLREEKSVEDAIRVEPFCIANIPLYSFRTINKYSISDLINEELTLANPKTFNDPFDTPLFNYLEINRNKIIKESEYDIKPLVDAYKQIKIRCFVKKSKKVKERPFEDQLMWSHYADSHKGICIRYRINQEVDGKEEQKLEYSNWHEIEYEEQVKFDFLDNQKMLSLLKTKKKCWEYENEVRLIHFDPNYDGEFKQLPLKEIGGKIEVIFFGCKCPPEDKLMIKKIFLNQNPPILFIEFPNNPEGIWNDIYKLKPEDEERFNKLS